MSDMWVRPIRQSDIPLVSEWLTKTKNNLLDADVLSYPTTTTLCATKDGPVAYLPVQTVAMMESLASKPGASKLDVSEALAALVKSIVLLGQTKGLGEAYFLSNDPDTIHFAKRHGFDDMTKAPDSCPHCGKQLPAPHTVTLRLKTNKIK